MNLLISSQNASITSNSKKNSSAHPKVSAMVNSSIANLKERSGSSLHAIKKYIGGHYEVNVEKLSPYIKKYLKQSVDNGILIQTKGEGANGSFKLSNSNKKKKIPVRLAKTKIFKPVPDKKKITKVVTAKKESKPKQTLATKKGKAKTPVKSSKTPKFYSILKGKKINLQTLRTKFIAKKQRNNKKKLRVGKRKNGNSIHGSRIGL